MNKAHVWRAALNRLRREITGAQVNAWLSGARLEDVAPGTATLQVRSSYEKHLIETRYRETIERALAETMGAPVKLRVTVGTASHHAASEAEKYQATHSQPLFALDDAATTTPANALDDANHSANSVNGANSANSVNSVNSVNSGQRPVAHAAPAAANRAPGDSVKAVPTPAASAVGGPGVGGGSSGSSGSNADRPAPPVIPTIPEGPGGERDWRETRASGIWRETPPPRVGEMATMNEPGDETMRPKEPAGPNDSGARQAPRPAPSGPGGPVPLAPPRLNQRYTWATFIVGSKNQLAHAASLAVAEAPGHAYNPLFLYGDVGLGKTHLLHAIGHTALERNLTVLYVSSETFTNEIVDAIRYRTTEEFRAKYRSVDVLLVDDIQFIAGKDSTEEEFFHTFNSLYETNRQIVICSDRPPKAIVSLEERLRSRFEWGLIADIQPPDLETRIAILRFKSDPLPYKIPDDIIMYLANRVQSNIRELEGSLNRVQAYAQLQGLPLTLDTAKAAMASLATDTRQRHVSIEDILKAVAEHYQLSVDDLRGKQRDKQIVVPRHVAMYLMRQETEASLQEIGQALGGRDHSTVLHGIEKIGREINESPMLRKDVLAIRQQLAD